MEVYSFMGEKSVCPSVASDEQGNRILALIRQEERNKDKLHRGVSQFVCLSEIDVADLNKNPDDFESYEDSTGPIEMSKEFVMTNPEAFINQTLEAQKILMSLNRQLNGEYETMRPTTFININNIRNINQTISISNFDDGTPCSKSLNEQSVELIGMNKEEDQPKILPKNKFTEVEVKIESSPPDKSSANSKIKKPVKTRAYKKRARKTLDEKIENESKTSKEEVKNKNSKQAKLLA